jgi:hypothetical protein
VDSLGAPVRPVGAPPLDAIVGVNKWLLETRRKARKKTNTEKTISLIVFNLNFIDFTSLLRIKTLGSRNNWWPTVDLLLLGLLIDDVVKMMAVVR